MELETYQIQIQDLFSGPVDLLLYLIRKHEVDVLQVSISTIVDQFLDYLNVLEMIDFNIAADFVVTASALLEIKSHLALLRDQPEENEEDEPEELIDNHNLIQHLMEYRRLREAAEMLQDQALAWNDRYPRLSDDRPDTRRSLADDHIRDLEIWDLVGAFSRIVRSKPNNSNLWLQFDTTPIHVYVERLGQQVREQGRVLFQSLFDSSDDRSRIVGMFLAVLELVRHHEFRAQQNSDFQDIWIMPPLEKQQTEEEDQAQSLSA